MVVHILVYFLVAALLFTFNVVNASYLPFIMDIVFVIVSILGIITVIMHYRAVEVELESENSVATRTEKYLVRFTVIKAVGFKGKNIFAVKLKGEDINEICWR